MRMRAFATITGLAAVAVACAEAPAPGPTPGGPQRCDAEAAKSLVGSHMGAVDFAPGASVRIVCTTCPTTRDYRPDRLNVRFDEATGIIKSVDCG